MHLHEINLGATAIGTGLNTHPDYAAQACTHLQRLTGLPLVTAGNLVEATQDCGAFVLFSGMLKRVAVKLSKICNDLRLLSSGPRAGFAEINLPPRQAGSSIMPGKVNPVIPEVVNQVAFEVIGYDLTVTMAAEAGQLQLNAFEPIIARSLFASLASLTAACTGLADHCIDGITANKEFLRSQVESSIGVVTVLNPLIGYDAATSIARQALVDGRSVTSLVLERGLLTAAELDEILRPERLANPQARATEPPPTAVAVPRPDSLPPETVQDRIAPECTPCRWAGATPLAGAFTPRPDDGAQPVQLARHPTRDVRGGASHNNPAAWLVSRSTWLARHSTANPHFRTEKPMVTSNKGARLGEARINRAARYRAASIRWSRISGTTVDGASNDDRTPNVDV